MPSLRVMPALGFNLDHVVFGPFQHTRAHANDLPVMEAMLTTFGAAFDDAETYGGARPSAAYLKRLLGSDSFMMRFGLLGASTRYRTILAVVRR